MTLRKLLYKFTSYLKHGERMQQESIIHELPKIVEILGYTKGQVNQDIYNRTAMACINSFTPVDKMDAKQKEVFQNDLIRGFEYRGWIV